MKGMPGRTYEQLYGTKKLKKKTPNKKLMCTNVKRTWQAATKIGINNQRHRPETPETNKATAEQKKIKTEKRPPTQYQQEKNNGIVSMHPSIDLPKQIYKKYIKNIKKKSKK